MDITIKDGIIIINGMEDKLENIRHSFKRLKMLSILSKTDGIGYQDNGFLTIFLNNNTICSTNAKDGSFKIYPVILDKEKLYSREVKETIDKIYEYCCYKINFYKEYALPIFSKNIDQQFDKLVKEACTTPTRNKLKRILLVTELHMMKKHTQDIIISKTISKEMAEEKFIGYMNSV